MKEYRHREQLASIQHKNICELFHGQRPFSTLAADSTELGSQLEPLLRSTTKPLDAQQHRPPPSPRPSSVEHNNAAELPLSMLELVQLVFPPQSDWDREVQVQDDGFISLHGRHGHRRAALKTGLAGLTERCRFWWLGMLGGGNHQLE